MKNSHYNLINPCLLLSYYQNNFHINLKNTGRFWCFSPKRNEKRLTHFYFKKTRNGMEISKLDTRRFLSNDILGWKINETNSLDLKSTYNLHTTWETSEEHTIGTGWKGIRIDRSKLSATGPCYSARESTWWPAADPVWFWWRRSWVVTVQRK